MSAEKTAAHMTAGPKITKALKQASEGQNPDTSLDDFLGGKVRLEQPLSGYRIAMDTVMLAAAVPALPGDHVLEGGVGSGGAAICLAARCPGVTVTGIDIQQELIALARGNTARNNLADRVTIKEGDILDLSGPQSQYDHVMINPPYLQEGAAMRPPSQTKGLAHMDSGADLNSWIRFAIHYVKQRGSITIVHRADRLDDIMARLRGRAGDIHICPLWCRPGSEAKRVIVQARKGSNGPTRLLAGLALHGHEERYSKEAEAILRDGASLDLKAFASRG